MYKEISFSNEILILDTSINRVVEKRKLYTHDNYNDEKPFIREREIYLYNERKFMSDIIRINRKYSSDTSGKSRRDNLNYHDIGIEKGVIKYYNETINFKTITYEVIELWADFATQGQESLIRIKRLDQGNHGWSFKYSYSNDDPKKLISIKEYGGIGIGRINTLKKETKQNLENTILEFDIDEQNYISWTNTGVKLLVHKSLLDEDIYYNTQNELLETYNENNKTS